MKPLGLVVLLPAVVAAALKADEGAGSHLGLTCDSLESREVAAGEPFGIIESVKAASDMYAPLSGEVVEAHTEVPDNPDMLKKDAYDGGWMVKIKASDAAQFDGMMDADAYRAFLESEG